MFDATDTAAIATAVKRVWLDEPLRARLVAAGTRRAGCFSWDRSARLFRALYRLVGNRELSAEDSALLAAEPLV
jgi:glycosyltransferase involved in cell wall biosynthesis